MVMVLFLGSPLDMTQPGNINEYFTGYLLINILDGFMINGIIKYETSFDILSLISRLFDILWQEILVH